MINNYNHIALFKTTRFKKIIGFLLGLFYAISLYLFLFIFRETIRYLSITENYDVWIFSEQETRFYNFIIAFISLIIGQSTTFIYWLTPCSSLNFKHQNKSISIHNELKFINNYSLNWFVLSVFVFGLLVGNIIQGGFYVIRFYPTYRYVCVLFVAVLFFQPWIKLILSYKRHGLKHLFISMTSILILSFALSKVNPIDYKKLNNICLNNNISYTYHLHLPESNVYEKSITNSLVKKIYVVTSNKHSAKPLVIINNKQISLQNIHNEIIKVQSEFSQAETRLIHYYLHIDKNISMTFIDSLKCELSKVGVTKIAYAVTPLHRKYDKRYYQNLFFPIYLPEWYAQKEIPINLFFSHKYVINIYQDNLGNIFLDTTLVTPNKFKDTIKELMSLNPRYVVYYHVNLNIKFDNYFKIISLTKEAIDDLRNENAQRIFSEPFRNLDEEQKIKIQKKYPFALLELFN